MTSEVARLLAGLLLCFAVCWSIKFFYHKERPVPDGTNSFPSTHTALMAVIAATLMPNIWGLIAICLVGYWRVYLKKHYVVDVIGGAAIGIVVTSCISYVQIARI